MDGIPSITSSALSALHAGFAMLDRAATKMAPPDGDPADGIVESIQAEEQVGAGVALMHTYERTTDDLIMMSDSRPRYQHLDVYA